MNLFEVQVDNFVNLLKAEAGYLVNMSYRYNRYGNEDDEEQRMIDINLDSIDFLVRVITSETKKYLKKNKHGLFTFYTYLNFIEGVIADVFDEIVDELKAAETIEFLDTSFFYDLNESIFNFKIYLKEVDDIALSCEEYYDSLKSSKVKEEIERFTSFMFIDSYNRFYIKNKKDIYNDLLKVIEKEKFKENDKSLDNLEKNIRKGFNKEFLNWIYVEDIAPTEGEIYITIDEFNEEVEAIYLNKNFVYLSSNDIVSDVIAYKNV